MKKTLLISLIVFLSFGFSSTRAAQRTVLFEHFSEDLCSYCPEVAAAMAAFRSHYSYQQVAIISYSVRGSDPVPDGDNRMDFFNKEFCPAVIGDGEADFEDLMPIEESDVVSYFNTRQSVASPLTMDVIKESNTNYRIIIHAESAVSGALMAVAYEDVTHDSVHYPCFARELLTDYYGDDFSIAAGETKDMVKTVELEGGWNPANMGVVAWVHEAGKNGRAFRAHQAFQAADSHAPHTNPTPTPPPTEVPVTPTPTSSSQYTPTPTPTFSETDIQQELVLNKTTFHPNDQFHLKVVTDNPGSSSVTVDQYVVLQVVDLFYFFPDWSSEPGSASRTFDAGEHFEEVIFDFTWPSGAGSFNPLYFWLASLNSGTATLACPYDMVEWGYAE